MTLSYNSVASSTLNRPDEMVFLPLGGTGEIGMNLSLYGYAGKWLMVDLGISFADDTMPGIDIIMPDPSFIVDRKDDLVGLVATHAHEDHIGAIPHLWQRLGCPIYATPFTASVLRAKLADAGLLKSVPLIEIPMSGSVEIGPFSIDLITLTHSIPEPNAVVIRTEAGRVLHTGDWKFDAEPLIGPTADIDALQRLGEAGVDALIGDSTNALRDGEAGSEADVRQSLIDLVGRYKRRVVVACFASNIARLQSAAVAAAAHGRVPALVGRSLLRMEQAARENGYLDGTPDFISDEEAAALPPERVLLICTGSQGEPRSALVRIANDDHPTISLDAGDTVIFSSRMIPGNEQAIGRLHNRLVRNGIDIVTEADHFVHVSGHPARDELARMYQLVRPKLAIPVHGESRHLLAHAKLAEACQVPHAIVAENGDMIRIAPGPQEIIDHIDAGRLALDGNTLVTLDNGTLRGRLRISANGSAVATVVLDGAGTLLAQPQVTLHGFIGNGDDLIAQLIEAAGKAVKGLPAFARGDDTSVAEAVRTVIRRGVNTSNGKKPVTDVHVVRV
jgi:ribonuclease J